MMLIALGIIVAVVVVLYVFFKGNKAFTVEEETTDLLAKAEQDGKAIETDVVTDVKVAETDVVTEVKKVV
jgi:hypothetical protein